MLIVNENRIALESAHNTRSGLLSVGNKVNLHKHIDEYRGGLPIGSGPGLLYKTHLLTLPGAVPLFYASLVRTTVGCAFLSAESVARF